MLFGIFTASVDPMSTYSTATDKPPSTREYFREAKARSSSYGKNFAVVGMMFAGIECTVESVSENYVINKFLNTESILQFYIFIVRGLSD